MASVELSEYFFDLLNREELRVDMLILLDLSFDNL